MHVGSQYSLQHSDGVGSQAQAQTPGTGVWSGSRRSHAHPRRRHVLHRGQDTQGPSFGNYDIGAP